MGTNRNAVIVRVNSFGFSAFETPVERAAGVGFVVSMNVVAHDEYAQVD